MRLFIALVDRTSKNRQLALGCPHRVEKSAALTSIEVQAFEPYSVANSSGGKSLKMKFVAIGHSSIWTTQAATHRHFASGSQETTCLRCPPRVQPISDLQRTGSTNLEARFQRMHRKLESRIVVTDNHGNRALRNY
jgi:hypothetical protein